MMQHNMKTFSLQTLPCSIIKGCASSCSTLGASLSARKHDSVCVTKCVYHKGAKQIEQSALLQKVYLASRE
eukprot:5474902-Amphidinium_carterae.1